MRRIYLGRCYLYVVFCLAVGLSRWMRQPFYFLKDRTFLAQVLITANDFRARLRFPRVTREPPRLCLRGLTCLAAVLRGTCHKPNRPRRQRAPFRPTRLMPPASEQSTSAFQIGHFSRRSLRLALQSTAGTSQILIAH
jgi:hypothetical protein